MRFCLCPISKFNSFSLCIIVSNPEISFFSNGIGGHDDAKLLIPATVVLRYMFAPAEMRVIFLSRRERQSEVPCGFLIFFPDCSILIFALHNVIMLQ